MASTLEKQIEKSLTGAMRMFANNQHKTMSDSERLKLSIKMSDEYGHVKHLQLQQQTSTPLKSYTQEQQSAIGDENQQQQQLTLDGDERQQLTADENRQQQQNVHANNAQQNVHASNNEQHTTSGTNLQDDEITELLQNEHLRKRKREPADESAVALYVGPSPAAAAQATGLVVHRGGAEDAALRLIEKRRKLESELQPQWHPPWKLKRVIAGHMGWVRALAVDPSNEWFASAGGDRTIKIWDVATGVLKLTLTGHASAVRGLAVSDRRPYLFSVGEDKMIKCWDLEQNKSIRQYHGHLSGIYCCALHPTLDLLVTGGRDSTVRVWDIRTKAQIFALSGHDNCVASLVCQPFEPQLISGSMDATIRCWDLAAGKSRSVLTNHKKSIRALVVHPTEYSFASASPDNIKKWKCPEAQFMHNFIGHKAIVNTLAVNHDNVMVSSADNGSMYFWDWKTGYNFASTQTIPQPGSLDSEAGIFCSVFDISGSRLITGETDKSIKMWAEDETATPETHPVQFTPNYETKLY